MLEFQDADVSHLGSDQDVCGVTDQPAPRNAVLENIDRTRDDVEKPRRCISSCAVGEQRSRILLRLLAQTPEYAIAAAVFEIFFCFRFGPAPM